MDNNKDMIEFIKNHPKEFEELVNIFKNLKFDNSSENKEEKALLNAVNELQEKYGLNDFVQNLLKFDLKKLLSLLKQKIKEIKTEKKGVLSALNVNSDFKKVEKHSMMLGLSCLACIKESVVSTINKEFYGMRLQKKQDISKNISRKF